MPSINLVVWYDDAGPEEAKLKWSGSIACVYKSIVYKAHHSVWSTLRTLQHAKHAAARGVYGHAPQENFYFYMLRDGIWWLFWPDTADE